MVSFEFGVDVLQDFTRHQSTFGTCINLKIGLAESQNHGTGGVGRDLERSSGPTLPPKQAAQVGVQTGLEYLQRRRLHNLPGQPVPVLRHPPREEVLWHVGAELPVLYLVAITPCPVSTNH